ncbi:MAG: hypothetical protein HN368_13585 [Spirochaetales bacterium]|jgi:hypothetical protein|nr:hypothetical protein [Spirochaetales bacterium]
MVRLCGLALAITGLAACSFYNSHAEASLILPGLPLELAEVFHIKEYVIRYLENDGQVIERTVSSTQTSTILALPKLPVVPVTATPICVAIENPDRLVYLKPAGAVFPADAVTDVVADAVTDAFGDADDTLDLELAWHKGFLADLLLSCSQIGDMLQAVNVQKLSQIVLEKCDGDPWSLDSSPLRTAIRTGSLQSRSVRKLPEYSLPLILPTGIWTSTNPLSDRLAYESDGKSIFGEIYEGWHSYVFRTGEENLVISVEPNGWRAVMSSQEGGLNGIW